MYLLRKPSRDKTQENDGASTAKWLLVVAWKPSQAKRAENRTTCDGGSRSYPVKLVQQSLHHSFYSHPTSLWSGTLPRMQKPVELCSSITELATVHKASKTDHQMQPRFASSQSPPLELQPACVLLGWRVLRATSPTSFISGEDQNQERGKANSWFSSPGQTGMTSSTDAVPSSPRDQKCLHGTGRKRLL